MGFDDGPYEKSNSRYRYNDRFHSEQVTSKNHRLLVIIIFQQLKLTGDKHLVDRKPYCWERYQPKKEKCKKIP